MNGEPTLRRGRAGAMLYSRMADVRRNDRVYEPQRKIRVAMGDILWSNGRGVRIETVSFARFARRINPPNILPYYSGPHSFYWSLPKLPWRDS